MIASRMLYGKEIWGFTGNSERVMMIDDSYIPRAERLFLSEVEKLIERVVHVLVRNS